MPIIPAPSTAGTQPKVYNAILDGGCAGDGVTDDTTALRASLTAARAAGKPLYLPKATYLVGLTTGTLFDLTTDSDWVFGDGKGETIIKQAASTAMTGNITYFSLDARGQRVNDLTINGNNPSGCFITSAAVVAGGSAYVNNDTINLVVPAGFYANQNIVLKVNNASGGVIQAGGVSVQTAGSWSQPYSAVGGGVQSSTSGVGTGATFTLTFSLNAHQQTGLLADQGHNDPIVERIECLGLYGGQTAGGTCLAAAAGAFQYESTPTLGTAVSAGGFATVTPSFINGSYPGRQIDVDTALASGKSQAVLAEVGTVGTGYIVGDVVTLSGGTATTQAQFYVGAVRTITAAINAAGTGYVPNDLCTVSGGTISTGVYGTPTVVKIATTVVVGTPGLVAAGTGGTPGAAVVTGTTGTGTKFTANVTISAGGIISSVNSLATAGSYTGNPTVLTNEPVTGGGLTGAALSVVMAAGTITISPAGSYSTPPSATAAATTDATTTTGSGLTVNLTFSMDQVGSLQQTGASAVAAAGSGYAVNDILAMTGGTFGQPACFRVTTINGSGGVTGVQQVLPGTYSVAPGNPVSVGSAWNALAGSASAGTGCTLTLRTFSFLNGPPVICGKYTAAPTNTVTPTGGTGTGALLQVEFNSEPIVVLANTTSTYTAWFQNAHLSTAVCGLYAAGTGQHGVFRDCYCHDCAYCTGLGGTATGMLFENIRVVNVGVAQQQHGVYWQGGNSTFFHCYFEGMSGYSIQLQQSQPNGDATGNKVINCVSVNPAVGHLVVNQAASPNNVFSTGNYRANQNTPLGENLNRACIITGCTFRCTNQSVVLPVAGVSIQAPTVISNCYFEDAMGVNTNSGTTGNWIATAGTTQANFSQIIGNRFRTLNCQQDFGIVNASANNMLIADNTFENLQGTSAKAIVSNGINNIIRGNQISFGTLFVGSSAITVGGANTEIAGNTFFPVPATGFTSNCSAITFTAGTVATGARVHDNLFNMGTNVNSLFPNATTPVVSIYNNDFGTSFLTLSGTTPVYGMAIYNNDVTVNVSGTGSAKLGRAAGRLLHGTNPNGTALTLNLGVKYDSLGNFIPCATTDTVFCGITPSSVGSSAVHWMLVAGQPGTEYPSVAVDGAWTAGHIGILSTTSAGKVHDIGTTIPPATQTVVGYAPVAAGTGYVPADALTLSGGTSSTAAILKVVTTKVVSATVAAGGTGGTNGTQTVTGTTGTGTFFTANVTVSGNAITAVNSITTGGSYTANPTTLATEPVTGASLTGAQLNVVMGVNTVLVSTGGVYTVAPANAVAHTGGTGTGATFNVNWGQPSYVQFLDTGAAAGTSRVQIVRTY